jgi:hypothetical protein
MSESKMVPREPTYGMTQAACAVAERIVNSGPMRPMADAIAAMYWRAMVDAAPTINEPVPPSSDDLVKELRFTHCQNDGLHDQAADAIASLTAERDALRADAERYRWLRNKMVHQQCGPNLGWTLDILIGGDDPDAAIDAERGRR